MLDNIRNTLGILVVTLFISGCSPFVNYQFTTVDSSLVLKEDKLKHLSKRHQEFWEYFSSKDFEKSYTYELPHLQFLKSLDWYQEFNAPNLKGYKITQLSIEEVEKDKAIVKYRYEKTGHQSLIIDDRWVFVDGEWYHYFEFSKLPSLTQPF